MVGCPVDSRLSPRMTRTAAPPTTSSPTSRRPRPIADVPRLPPISSPIPRRRPHTPAVLAHPPPPTVILGERRGSIAQTPLNPTLTLTLNQQTPHHTNTATSRLPAGHSCRRSEERRVGKEILSRLSE